MARYQTAKIGVKGVIRRGDRVLLLHRREDPDLAPDLWDLPGGGVEVGDDLEESLAREVREETGFLAKVGRPVHAWIARSRFTTGRRITSVIVCYECSTRTTRAPRLAPEEHTEFRWVRLQEIGRYRLPPNQPVAIRKALAGR